MPGQRSNHAPTSGPPRRRFTLTPNRSERARARGRVVASTDRRDHAQARPAQSRPHAGHNASINSRLEERTETGSQVSRRAPARRDPATEQRPTSRPRAPAAASQGRQQPPSRRSLRTGDIRPIGPRAGKSTSTANNCPRSSTQGSVHASTGRRQHTRPEPSASRTGASLPAGDAISQRRREAQVQVRLPTPRPNRKPRFKPTPRSNRPITAQEDRSASSRLRPFQSSADRSLYSLSPGESLHLAAHVSTAVIAMRYRVHPASVHFQLSKMIIKKGHDEVRTIKDAKHEFNIKRHVNRITPAINQIYGVHEGRPRTRAGGGRAGPSVPVPAAVDSHQVTEDVTVDSEMHDNLTGFFRADSEDDRVEDGLPGSKRDSPFMMANQQGQIEEESMTDSPREEAAAESLGVKNLSASHSTERIGGPGSAVVLQGSFGLDGAQTLMPREVLHNAEAFRLWVLGYRDKLSRTRRKRKRISTTSTRGRSNWSELLRPAKWLTSIAVAGGHQG